MSVRLISDCWYSIVAPKSKMHNTYAKIVVDRYGRLHHTFEDGPDMLSISATKLVGVSVTKELLIKWFGFDEFKPGFLNLDAWSPGHPSARFDMGWKDGLGFMLKSRYQGDSDSLTMRHIKYMHQVQELYRGLTGEELKRIDIPQ